MAIKGQTINVALDPRGYKEMNHPQTNNGQSNLENLIPTHIDLRNGHYTDNKRWEKRPGYEHILTLTELPPVTRTPTEEDGGAGGGGGGGGGVTCTDTTHIGQQTLVWSQFVANEASGGNTRTSWGYLDDDGEVYTLVGTGTCGGGNMPYGNSVSCCEINHYTDGGATLEKISPPNLPGSAGLPNAVAVNCRPGQSDEPMFHIANDGVSGSSFVYPVRDLRVNPRDVAGYGLNAWAKDGDDLYLALRHSSNVGLLVRYPAHDTTRPSIDTASSGNVSNISAWYAVSATTSNLYALYDNTSSQRRIHTSTRADLTTYSDLVDVTGLGIGGIHARADGTIYMFGEVGSQWIVYYWNGSAVVFVGYTARVAQIFSAMAMHFRNRVMYAGGRGVAGFSPGIFKVDMPCDEGESMFATLTTSAATVAAGGTISVLWEDVLNPAATDRIYLRAAPANDYDPGFTGTIVSSQLTTGAGSGSINFTVPGGTAAGDYIFQYAALNSIYVCRSAVVTVT